MCVRGKSLEELAQKASCIMNVGSWLRSSSLNDDWGLVSLGSLAQLPLSMAGYGGTEEVWG